MAELKLKWLSSTNLLEIRKEIAEQRAKVEFEDNALRVRAQQMTKEQYELEKERVVVERDRLRKMVKEGEKVVKESIIKTN